MRLLLLPLCLASALRDAEDDMDKQLQMFASRYMFATDNQISDGLDREKNDLSLGLSSATHNNVLKSTQGLHGRARSPCLRPCSLPDPECGPAAW